MRRFFLCCLSVVVCVGVSACGLIAAPFRVVGAVADGTYEGGKKVANSISERSKRKAAEKEKAEAEAKKKAESGGVGGAADLPGMPPLPVDGQTDIMGEPIKPGTPPPPTPLGTPLPPIEMPR